MPEIAKNCMNSGGQLRHKFTIFDKNFAIDLLNEVYFRQQFELGVSPDSRLEFIKTSSFRNIS